MYLSVNFLTLTKVSTPTPPPHLRTMRVPWSLPGERIAPLVVKNKGLESLESFFSELNSPVSLHFISLNFKTGGPNCTTNTSNCSYDSPLPCGRQKTKMKKFQCIAFSQEQSHIYKYYLILSHKMVMSCETCRSTRSQRRNDPHFNCISLCFKTFGLQRHAQNSY